MHKQRHQRSGRATTSVAIGPPGRTTDKPGQTTDRRRPGATTLGTALLVSTAFSMLAWPAAPTARAEAIAHTAPASAVAAPAAKASASMALVPATPTPAVRYRLPIADAAVVHPFDGPPKPWLPGHRGVDLATSLDAEVLAPADGVVTFAGWVVDRATVTIEHPDGLRSSLEPVTASVAVGTTVSAGSVLGHVSGGANHCAPESCVHWGVRRGDQYLDPMSLLGPRTPDPVILLPWRDD